MATTITLTITPEQLDVVGQALTVLRDRLYCQVDSATPLEAIRARKRLRELEPVEAVIFAELNKLYEPQTGKGVKS